MMSPIPRILAVIAARGGSKRVPGKNLRPFCGTPLISWSIRFARSCRFFDHVIVSTDDPKIAALAAEEGLPVPFLRPNELASDSAGSADVVLHALDFEAASGRQYDLVALLQPTSPVRESRRIEAAIAALNDPSVMAAVGVKPVDNHPFHTFSLGDHGKLTPFIDGNSNLRSLRSQDLPPAYSIAGNIYLVRTATFRANPSFFPAVTTGIICDEPCEALDIDTEDDWVIAETLTEYFGKKPWPRSS